MKSRSLIVLALLACAGTSRAQDAAGPPEVALHPDATTGERARAEFAAGQAAYSRRDFPAAIAAFERAYGLLPAPDILYDLAQAERLAGRCDAALTHYRQFVELYTRTPADIEKKIAEVADCAAKAAASASPAPVAPPTHETPAPHRTPAPPPVRSEKAVPDWAAWTLTGAGVASLIAGTVLTAMVVRRQSTVEQECPGKVCRDLSGLEAASEGQKLFAGSIAAYAVGATGLGLGVYFLADSAGDHVNAVRVPSSLPKAAVWTLTSQF